MAEKFKYHRARENFARQRAYQRTGMPRVLIVTEGAVTEVEYFTDMCRSLGLSPITVHPAEGIDITGRECGSAPISVVKYAQAKFFEKEPKVKGLAQKYYWDEVYCVFDRDTHASYHDALVEIQATQEKDNSRVFRAITSHRCFELWFLLHFKYTSKDFINSAAIGKELKKILCNGQHIFADYEHGNKGIFKRITDKLETAKIHAKKLNKAAGDTVDQPHTYVVDLVNRIEEIAKLRQTLGIQNK